MLNWRAGGTGGGAVRRCSVHLLHFRAGYRAAGFAVWVPSRGFRQSFISATWTAGAVALFTAGLLTILKLWSPVILQGVTRACVANREFQGLFLAVTTSWAAVGLIAVLAVISVVLSAAAGESRDRVLSLAVLAGAAFLVPLYQLHLETDWDMWKHVSLGLWFASIPAGVLIGRLVPAPQVTRRGFLTCGAAVALVFPVVSGWQAAWDHFHSWPNAAPLISRLRPLVAASHGPFYMDGAPTTVISYYEGSNAWSNNGAPPACRWLPGSGNDAQIARARYGLVTLVFPGNGSARPCWNGLPCRGPQPNRSNFCQARRRQPYAWALLLRGRAGIKSFLSSCRGRALQQRNGAKHFRGVEANRMNSSQGRSRPRSAQHQRHAGQGPGRQPALHDNNRGQKRVERTRYVIQATAGQVPSLRPTIGRISTFQLHIRSIVSPAPLTNPARVVLV